MPVCLTQPGTSTASRSPNSCTYLAENDPLIAPALEEGLHKDEAFMRSPEALERYIEVARMGGNTQMARQIHLQQVDYSNPPRYNPSPPPHGFNSWNSLTGLPNDVMRHTLEIDGGRAAE